MIEVACYRFEFLALPRILLVFLTILCGSMEIYAVTPGIHQTGPVESSCTDALRTVFIPVKVVRESFEFNIIEGKVDSEIAYQVSGAFTPFNGMIFREMSPANVGSQADFVCTQAAAPDNCKWRLPTLDESEIILTSSPIGLITFDELDQPSHMVGLFAIDTSKSAPVVVHVIVRRILNNEAFTVEPKYRIEIVSITPYTTAESMVEQFRILFEKSSRGGTGKSEEQKFLNQIFNIIKLDPIHNIVGVLTTKSKKKK